MTVSVIKLNDFLVLIVCCFLLQDVIMQYLTTDDLKLNSIDSEDPEVGVFSIMDVVSQSKDILTLWWYTYSW